MLFIAMHAARQDVLPEHVSKAKAVRTSKHRKDNVKACLQVGLGDSIEKVLVVNTHNAEL